MTLSAEISDLGRSLWGIGSRIHLLDIAQRVAMLERDASQMQDMLQSLVQESADAEYEAAQGQSFRSLNTCQPRLRLLQGGAT